MLEIKIKNLEDGKELEYEADGLLLLTMNEDDDKSDSVVVLETSIENMSNAMLQDGKVRAACRLALAKWDGLKDVKEEKMGEVAEKLVGVMKDLQG